MEWTSPPVPFPLLADPSAYTACSVPMRTHADDPTELTVQEKAWVESFRRSVPLLRQVAESDSTVNGAKEKAAKFEARFLSLLDDFDSDPESHGGPPDVLLLYQLRDLCLGELGFEDVNSGSKEQATSAALQQLPGVLRSLDGITDDAIRIEQAIRGMFAGMKAAAGWEGSSGAEEQKDHEVAFADWLQQLPPRPWLVDDLDVLVDTWTNQKSRMDKVVLFCARAGHELVLGVLPMIRLLTQRGAQVVLTSNDSPSGTSITHEELLLVLQQFQSSLPSDSLSTAIASGRVVVVSAGGGGEALDLSTVSPELAFTASDADLVILMGQARALESNFYAKFKCPSLRIAVVERPEVAQHFRGEVHDCVVKCMV